MKRRYRIEQPEEKPEDKIGFFQSYIENLKQFTEELDWEKFYFIAFVVYLFVGILLFLFCKFIDNYIAVKIYVYITGGCIVLFFICLIVSALAVIFMFLKNKWISRK